MRETLERKIWYDGKPGVRSVQMTEEFEDCKVEMWFTKSEDSNQFHHTIQLSDTYEKVTFVLKRGDLLKIANMIHDLIDAENDLRWK